METNIPSASVFDSLRVTKRSFKVQGNIFKCLILFEQQPKSPKHSAQNDIEQTKALLRFERLETAHFSGIFASKFLEDDSENSR